MTRQRTCPSCARYATPARVSTPGQSTPVLQQTDIPLAVVISRPVPSEVVE